MLFGRGRPLRVQMRYLFRAQPHAFDGKLYIFLELRAANSVTWSLTQSSALLALVPEPVLLCLKTLRRQFGVECLRLGCVFGG